MHSIPGLLLLGMASASLLSNPTSVPQEPTRAPTPSFALLAEAQKDIVDTASADSSLTTFVKLVKQVGIAEDLRGYGRFTVFAPNDAAFAQLGPEVLGILANDSGLLAKILTYHVLVSSDPLASATIEGAKSYRTLQRGEIRIVPRDGGIYVNDARIVRADLRATNGIVHVIDKVLIPDDLLGQIRIRQQSVSPPSTP